MEHPPSYDQKGRLKLANVVNTHKDGFEILLEELAKLPKGARTSCGLYYAARLIEESAYAYAYDLPGDQIAGLIMLAADVEKSAAHISDTARVAVN